MKKFREIYAENIENNLSSVSEVAIFFDEKWDNCINKAREMGIDVMVINVENKDITPEELKEFCRKSGVHIYCDKRTVVYANKGFVFMHTGESAEHNFTAFGKTEFTDLYTGEKVKFPLKLPLGKSFLFKAE